MAEQKTKRDIAALQGMNEENFVKFENSEAMGKSPCNKKMSHKWSSIIYRYTSYALFGCGLGYKRSWAYNSFLQDEENKKEKKILDLLTVDGTILHHQLRERIENDHNDPIEEKNV